MSIPVPPEIPEEFAEAYREAYAQALAEQSPVARHVELPQNDHDDDLDDVPDDERWAHELPVRVVPPASGGAHRDAEPPASRSEEDTSREAQRQVARARAKRDARKRADAEASVMAAEQPQDDGGPNLFWLLVVIAVLCVVLGAYILGLAVLD